MLRRSSVVRACIGVLLASAVSAGAPHALAQTDEQRAAARSLATEGAAAFNEGRWKDAIDLFSRAEALVHAPPHLLFLARAHEKLGQLVKARETYLKIIKETLPANAPQAFRDARASAEQELQRVDPRIASLTVKVQGAEDAKDLTVLVDGVAIPSVLVGVARPIDPGEHRIEAVATGFRAQPETVRLADGERRQVALTLVPDASAAPPADALTTPPPDAPPTSATVTPTPASPAPRAPDTPTSSGGNDAMRIGAYVAYGVGAVGLGLGTVFLLSSSSKRKDADAAYDACLATGDCRENDAAARKTASLDDEARSAMTLSIVGFAAGGVGVAVGTALLLASSGSSQERPPTGLSVRPFVGFDRAGLYGTF